MTQAIGLSLMEIVADWAYTPESHSLDWWDMLRYYYLYFQNQYSDFAIVVRISYFMAGVSALSIIMVFIMMLRTFFKRRRNHRYLRKITKHHAEGIAELLNSTNHLTAEGVREMTKVYRFPHKFWKIMQWGRLLSEEVDKMRHQIDDNDRDRLNLIYGNLHTFLNIHGIPQYLERMLRESISADRVLLVQLAQQFRMDLSESTLLRMARSKNLALRKVVKYYFMRSNNEDPFRFIEDGGDSTFVQADAIWFNRVMWVRHKEHKPIPPLVPLATRSHNSATRAILVREAGRWHTAKDMEQIPQFFQSQSDEVRRAAFDAVGLSRDHEAARKMMDVYDMQPESLRRCILRSLSASQLDGVIPFFEQAVQSAASAQTRRLALRCLWHAGPAGQGVYFSIKTQDPHLQDNAALYDMIEQEDGSQPLKLTIDTLRIAPPSTTFDSQPASA